MFKFAMNYSELTENFKKVIVIDEQKILFLLLADKVYAIKDTCPHLGASLSKGNTEGHSITCRAHGAKFNLESGDVIDKAHISFLKIPTKKAVTYEVKIENGKVLINM